MICLCASVLTLSPSQKIFAHYRHVIRLLLLCEKDKVIFISIKNVIQKTLKNIDFDTLMISRNEKKTLKNNFLSYYMEIFVGTEFCSFNLERY